MARHEISYFITYWYQHEPSSTFLSRWTSGSVKKVKDGWEVKYLKSGVWEDDDLDIAKQRIEDKLEEVGPEEMLDGCIHPEDNFDEEYDGYELDFVE